MSVPVEYFSAVDGSITSDDGKHFFLKARCDDGEEMMLGFPHSEIPNVIECAAMQHNHFRHAEGDPVANAFLTSGFQLGRGPKGEAILILLVGEIGKISFLHPHGMVGELEAALVRAQTRH